MILEYAYVRRVRFEAQIQATAIVEILAQVLLGKGASGKYGLASDGTVFRNISTEAGLARMGIFL